ncbi:hypothetical protein PGQ11_000056 [Apiospora arundinis]
MCHRIFANHLNTKAAQRYRPYLNLENKHNMITYFSGSPNPSRTNSSAASPTASSKHKKRRPARTSWRRSSAASSVPPSVIPWLPS